MVITIFMIGDLDTFWDKTLPTAIVKLKNMLKEYPDFIWLAENGRSFRKYSRDTILLVYHRKALTNDKDCFKDAIITSWERGLKHAGLLVLASTHGDNDKKIWVIDSDTIQNHMRKTHPQKVHLSRARTRKRDDSDGNFVPPRGPTGRKIRRIVTTVNTTVNITASTHSTDTTVNTTIHTVTKFSTTDTHMIDDCDMCALSTSHREHNEFCHQNRSDELVQSIAAGTHCAWYL